MVPAPEVKRRTIAEEVETHLKAKGSDGLTKATLRKLKSQLGMFEQFLAGGAKFFTSEITPSDVIEFRSGWTWKSGVTRQKAQQNLRGFLRFCCKDNLEELLKVLKSIKLSKADHARLEPQPFTEQELRKLLAQVPKTFLDPVKAARMTALIHCQVSTGLTIRDTVQLERENPDLDGMGVGWPETLAILENNDIGEDENYYIIDDFCSGTCIHLAGEYDHAMARDKDKDD